jgi:hypothetical protein
VRIESAPHDVAFALFMSLLIASRDNSGLPLLKRLDFFGVQHAHHATRESTNFASQIVFQNAPQFTEVSLSGLAVRPDALELPWDRLTRLFFRPLYDWTGEELYGLLGRLPKLTYLHLNVDCARGDILDAGPVTLPVLKTLSIVIYDYNPAFLRGLILPALVDLHITFRGGCGEFDQRAAGNFSGFLSRSGAGLRKLRISHPALRERELAMALRQSPMLTSLTIAKSKGYTT